MAKIFNIDKRQKVDITEESESYIDKVPMNKIGDDVILMPKEKKWSAFLDSLSLFSEDFMNDGRQ